MIKKANTIEPLPCGRANEGGFSLIEAVIAMVILMIVVMGVFAAVTYSTRYNTGNSRRSQSLSVFQRKIEELRSAKFTPTVLSAALNGGTITETITLPNNNGVYLVETTVDDDTFTAGDQIIPTTALKEIRIVVTPQGTDGAWVNAARARMVLRRVRAN